MSDNSKIEWCDATLNVFRGCSKVSAGCMHCYAEAMAARFHKPGQWGESLTKDGRWTGDIQFSLGALQLAFKWKRPRRIFINSTSDTFHPNVKEEWLNYLFATVALNPHHTFIVLTKRPDRMCEYMCRENRDEAIGYHAYELSEEFGGDTTRAPALIHRGHPPHGSWPLPNLWLGVSVEDQATAEQRITPLLAAPAAVRFVSAEPLLGPVDLTRLDMDVMFGIDKPDPHGYRPKHYFDALRGMSDINPIHGAEPDLAALDWLIVGGESGPKARPIHPDWVRGLRDQCTATDTPFFFKQWGEWGFAGGDCTHMLSINGNLTTLGNAPGDADWPCAKIGKRKAGHLLDGVAHREFPAQTTKPERGA